MVRSNLFSRWIVTLGTLACRLWFTTCRVKIVGRELHRRYVLSRQPVVGATWHRTWDKTLIPLPFSRMTVAYEKPWVIPPDLYPEAMEHLRAEVQETLNRMMRTMDADTNYKDDTERFDSDRGRVWFSRA